MAPTIFSSLLKFFSICSAQSTISYQLFYRMWKSETYRKSSLFFIPDTFVTWSNPTKILRHWPFQYLQCITFALKLNSQLSYLRGAVQWQPTQLSFVWFWGSEKWCTDTTNSQLPATAQQAAKQNKKKSMEATHPPSGRFLRFSEGPSVFILMSWSSWKSMWSS